MGSAATEARRNAGRPDPDSVVGVRERKRRALRQQLSETATVMFLEHGFDAVRVSDVAQACGVSTKTVWNHFPTKEALLFDRGEILATVLRNAAAEPTDVLAAVLACIYAEIERLDPPGPVGGNGVLQSTQAFALLCESNPSLRAATADRLEQLTQLAAQALAAQDGTEPVTPQNQIAASALVSLWRVHLGALLRLADLPGPPAAVRATALAEVEAAAMIVARIIPAAAVQA